MHIFKPHQAIDIISHYLPANPLIIEAGAFNGSDTIAMAKKWPKATIHAFEPVPQIYEKLVANTKEYPNIHTHNYALSNQSGSATFYVSEKPTKPCIASQAGSLLAPKERLKYSPMQFPYTIEVPTITLDQWAEKNNIKKIDFIWLDTQGAELAILKAAPTMIKNLTAIYLEIGFYENYANQPSYQKIKSWLSMHNLEEVGRDFETMKKHFFGNCLFAGSVQSRISKSI